MRLCAFIFGRGGGFDRGRVFGGGGGRERRKGVQAAQFCEECLGVLEVGAGDLRVAA